MSLAVKIFWTVGGIYHVLQLLYCVIWHCVYSDTLNWKDIRLTNVNFLKPILNDTVFRE